MSGLKKETDFRQRLPLNACSTTAGAAVGLPLTETLAKIFWVEDMDWKNFSPLACAYAEGETAAVCLSSEISSLFPIPVTKIPHFSSRSLSDGVIAPGYTEEALEILHQKKKGNYNIMQSTELVPDTIKHKQVYGVTFEQGRQELAIDDQLISNIVTTTKS